MIRYTLPFCCLLSFLVAEAQPHILSVSEARKLVFEALGPETKKLSGLTLEPGKPQGNCLTFDVLWSNPGPGSVHVAFYSIDLRTVVIRSPISCTVINKPSLLKLQRAARKRLGVSQKEYRESLQRAHCCG